MAEVENRFPIVCNLIPVKAAGQVIRPGYVPAALRRAACNFFPSSLAIPCWILDIRLFLQSWQGA
jgi:hypothetical protein